MKTKRMLVQTDLLSHALRLPEGARVVEMRLGNVRETWELVVVSDEFEDVTPGEVMPLSRPLVTETVKSCGCKDVTWEWK